MKEACFHAAVYLPGNLALPTEPFWLEYTRHASREAARDRYGDLTPLLPAALDPASATVVEVGVGERFAVTKVLYRVPAGDVDLCLVVRPRAPGVWRVVTVWANLPDDTHATLDESLYAAP